MGGKQELSSEERARRRLLRLMVYVPPAIVGTLALSQVDCAPKPSCIPESCNPRNPCQPNACVPDGGPCNPIGAPCNPNPPPP